MKDAKNLHVPMPSDLHDELRKMAAQLGKPATVLAREAIERYLGQLHKQAVDAAIQDWAREVMGTQLELDPQLEAAGVEFLLGDA